MLLWTDIYGSFLCFFSSEKYYDALKKRTTPLSGMQPSDLNPPEAAGSVIAVPSVLLGGLVAMLAMASV